MSWHGLDKKGPNSLWVSDVGCPVTGGDGAGCIAAHRHREVSMVNDADHGEFRHKVSMVCSVIKDHGADSDAAHRHLR